MSEESGDKKQKKSKLEKIYELQAALKSVKEENRTLRRQLHAANCGAASISHEPDGAPVSSSEQKLLEAMKALKRVTVKQEMSLNTIKQKANERRRQVDERDKKIHELQQEIKTLQEAHKARKLADSNSDIDGLRSEVEDLQLTCSEQENRNKMLALQLEAAEDKARNLQKQLDSARGLLERAGSTRSLKSVDTAASEFDVARMRKELASKIERIVLLEFDLEMCRDELHELRQKQMMSDTFPQEIGGAHAATSSGDNDYFSSGDGEDDDTW